MPTADDVIDPDAKPWLQVLTTGGPLGRLIADRLADAIVEGVIPPGTKLKEEELAAGFDTSRTPVREALRLLERDSLVTVVPRRGVHVTELSAGEAVEVYTVRAYLSGLAVKLATARATPKDLEMLTAVHQEMEVDAKRREGRAYVRGAIRFDDAVAAVAGNELLVQLLERLGHKTMRLRYAAPLSPEHLHESARGHDAVLKAMRAGDGAEAEARMRDLIVAAWEVLANQYFHLDEATQQEDRFQIRRCLIQKTIA